MGNSSQFGASHAGNGLPLIVEINEQIKDILRISNEINLAAINAMLIANKISKGKSGFGVVSSELRIFSTQLSEAMQVLLGYVTVLVQEMAGQIRLNKVLQLQQAACAGSQQAACLGGVVQSKLDGLAERDTARKQHHDKLVAAVTRAKRLCVMGLSLSYSAKIEAVYGESQAGALKQVSEGVEHAISAILQTLEKLEKQLERDV